jgi:hypothetical protein
MRSVGWVGSFLVLVAVAFFADGVRVRLEARDPSSLPAVETRVARSSRRVVLVILDSVPLRVGTDPAIMPNLVALASRGASGVMIAPPDTTTTAGVRAMSVGTKPSLRDTLDMFSQTPFRHWTLFDELVGRGEQVAFFGDHAWADLLGDRAVDQHALASENLFADDQASLGGARERLRSNDRSAFVVLHIGRTDFMAHQFGTERPEYRAGLRDVDSELNRFFLDVFDEGTTFIVTADHGCDLYGSHGGGGDIYRRVPLVLVGSGIAPVHGFEMDHQQMPLVLATLLGTRLPGGILSGVTTALLALDDAQRARLAVANLARVHALAAFHEIPGSPAALRQAREALDAGSLAEAIRISDDTVRTLLGAIAVSSRPEPGMLIWIAVLFLAMALAWLATVAAIPGQAPALAAACGLSVLLILTSSLRLPALLALAALEAALLAAAIWKMGSARQRIGASIALVGAVGIAAVSALRFSQGGAYLAGMAKPGAGIAAILAVGAVWLYRRSPRGMFAGAELCAIPIVLFGLGVLKPVDLVPVLVCGLLVLALRAGKLSWPRVAVAAGALLVFFVVSQRIGFGFTGERPWARYLYAGVGGGALTAMLALKFERTRRWVIPAMLCLFALWPFGFISFGYSPMSGATQSILLALTWIATLAFAWRMRILKICALPLLTALVYHLFPTSSSFVAALAAHLGALVVISIRASENRVKHLSIAGVAFSMLYVMSPDLDIASVILFSTVLFLATRAPTEALDDTALTLLGALLLICVRYGILNSFGHIGGGLYSLSNLDLHSGFAAMSKDVMLWVPTTLVVFKMVCASTLVFALLLSGERFRRLESRLVLASFAMVMAFLVEASIEVALSYGPNEARLPLSMVQVIFHAGILVLLFAGYGGYKLLLLRTGAGSAVEAVNAGGASTEPVARAA